MVRELHPVLVTIVASQQLSASSNITRARRAARPRPDRTRVSRSARWSAVSTNDVDGMRHHMVCNKSLVQATRPSVQGSRDQVESVVLSRSCGPVAQLGARMNGIHEVTGSIPVWSTTF